MIPFKTVATATLIAAALAGCSSTPRWDARFGEPVAIITAQQVINPDAALNPDPVAGVDGKAAQGAISQYGKSFTQPQSQPDVLMFGLEDSGS